MNYFETEILSRRFRGYVPEATERSYYHGKRPAVVIYPGGGYALTYEGEAEPIALKFAAEGIPAFVLDYTCNTDGKGVYPKPMQEAFAAIRYVRENAEKFGIDPKNIASLGFSAGGHLCACTGTLWDKPVAKDWVGDEPEKSRPDKMILCYAVLKAKGMTHVGSFVNLFGPHEPDDPRLALVDAVENCGRNTPPTFLWATAGDDAVPVVNTVQFAEKLAECGVPFALHVWEHGHHGLCLGNHVTEARPYGQNDEVVGWVEEVVRFLYTPTA